MIISIKKDVLKVLTVIILGLFVLKVNATMLSKKDSILLTGSVYNNDDRVKDVVLTIYDKNTLIKTVKVKSSTRFRLYLPKNADLTINISAPSFHDKRFFFDTHVPDKVKILPGYEFDIDIYKEEELAGVNPSLLDFPAGIVKYSEKKGEFLRDKAYTKKMKNHYYNLLEEASMSERGTGKVPE